ncbi:uncharacterized protein LOC119739599 [Patiria miniata]|uniref:Uncharacterized protein n=1 Tax=Patiria miniata TaxID=46514 RepID=A0A914B2E7_PATMI|nr:uncharacterized protein LOC119739599 [Patiria miniata]
MKLLQVALMCGLIGGILGLECWNCLNAAGLGSAACHDPFNTSTTDPAITKTTCTTGYDTCAKIFYGSGNTRAMLRQCYLGAGCPSQNGCASGSYEGETATFCCCNGNLCNGAGSVSVNLLTTAAVCLAALFALY